MAALLKMASAKDVAAVGNKQCGAAAPDMTVISRTFPGASPAGSASAIAAVAVEFPAKNAALGYPTAASHPRRGSTTPVRS
jgi:hypothetical protein